MDPHGSFHGLAMNSANLWANTKRLDDAEAAHLQLLNQWILPSPSPAQPIHHDTASPCAHNFPPLVGTAPQMMMQPRTLMGYALPIGSTTQASFPQAINNVNGFAYSTPSVTNDPNDGLVPQLQNVVAKVDLGCKLDLKEIVQRALNAEYKPKLFAAVVMRIRDPRTTALIFSSGKMLCTGAKSEDQSRVASRKFARIIQKLGFEAKFLDFKIENMVGICDMRFSIRLEGLYLAHSQFANYEPELFPGLIYKMIKPKVVLLIFCSGKVVLTGAKKRSDMCEAIDNIAPVLESFRRM